MGYVSKLFRAWNGSERTATPNEQDAATRGRDDTVQCRDCGRWYTPTHTTCPHCASSNRLKQGPPPRPRD